MTECPSCSAPMAADQRYCLNCGLRAGEARLPFLEVLSAGDAQRGDLLPVAPVRGAAPLLIAGPPTAQERLRANSGLIAGVGVLLLAMLIGVLIGSGFGDDTPQAAAAPQIITVGGAPVAATGATGADPAAEAAVAGAAAGSAKTAKKKKASSASSPAAAKKPAATNSAVKNLDNLTGKAAQKAADKLGKTIATGGKAPKKDNKPAAGGGSFEEIG